MLDMEDQIDDQTESFGEFFAGYDDNQYAVTIPCHNIHLPSSNTTGISSDLSHISFKDDLFGELSASDLLKFTCQEAWKLFDIESI